MTKTTGSKGRKLKSRNAIRSRWNKKQQSELLSNCAISSPSTSECQDPSPDNTSSFKKLESICRNILKPDNIEKIRIVNTFSLICAH